MHSRPHDHIRKSLSDKFHMRQDPILTRGETLGENIGVAKMHIFTVFLSPPPPTHWVTKNKSRRALSDPITSSFLLLNYILSQDSNSIK